MKDQQSLRPLKGIRVLDFGHTVMGPCCGMILADLGAEVIKVEPTGAGDPTRYLKGFGSGYFGFFARNKRSVSIDLKSEGGRKIAHRLVKSADVLIENFAPGTMERLGMDRETVCKINPGLVYASLKGFMDGPYVKRLALDEVVQMMGGLAYMTGPTGQPLRAGTSVVDIAGGMFAVIGILSALRDRDRTGCGTLVETALFEMVVYLMGQHLCYAEQSKAPIPPMPERVSAWAIYEIFECSDDSTVFVGITTDNHWQRFCGLVGWTDFLEDPGLATNALRIDNKPRIQKRFAEFFRQRTSDEACAVLEDARVPFAPVQRPEDLFTDPHLAAADGLLKTHLPDGTATRLPRLPLHIGGMSCGDVRSPPRVGADTREILEEIGMSAEEIAEAIDTAAVQAEDCCFV